MSRFLLSLISSAKSPKNTTETQEWLTLHTELIFLKIKAKDQKRSSENEMLEVYENKNQIKPYYMYNSMHENFGIIILMQFHYIFKKIHSGEQNILYQ